MKALLLSLGHNSSAIYTNGTANIGYETERLDRVKSSSRSPIKAVHEIEKRAGIQHSTPIFVTHWFDSFNVKLPECKYAMGIEQYSENKASTIVTHSKDFTHHDAHAWSSYSFYKYYRQSARSIPVGDDMHFIVADGFGNMQEVISVYSMSIKKDNGPQLIGRCYGYGNSLGLMYQYATKYVGMKMNQDEYKFLGYENLVEKFFNDKQISTISTQSQDVFQRFLKDYIRDKEPIIQDSELIGYTQLEYTQSSWFFIFDKLLKSLDIEDKESVRSRVAVGYFIQDLIETVLISLLSRYDIKNVCLSGGIFYNVKLNNRILKSVEGQVSIVPLAGDQGAAIGFYQKFIGDFDWSTLAIGDRGEEFWRGNLQRVKDESKCIYVPETREEAIDLVKTKILAGDICNLVTNKMEYGPRALGNTSSIFLPTEDNSSRNNKLNKRNEVMPFAPLILDGNLCNVFQDDQYNRIIGSDQFMIVTYDYKNKPTEAEAGVYHHYPRDEKWSGRPQVITAKNHHFLYVTMFDLFVNDHIKLLTNTSYNYHGEPIVYSMMDILGTHQKQLINAKEDKTKVNLILFNPKE